MRIWLNAAVAASVLVLAMAGIASAPARPPAGHGKGKGSLPPIDTSNAANCDFIAEPGNALCLLPVPRRLLHAARRQQPDRAAGRPQDRRDAGQRVRRPHRRRPLQRLRRLQPGRDDPAQGARDRHRRRRPRDRRGADQPHPPLPAAERAGRRPRRDDRTRGGRSGSRSTPTPPTRRKRSSRSTRRSTSPPATATSSPFATSQTPRARQSKRPQRFRYYRDNVPSDAGGDQRPPHALRRIFKTPAEMPGSIATTSTSPGTSRWRATRTTPARELAMRNAAFAQLGDTDLSDLTPSGQLADFT